MIKWFFIEGMKPAINKDVNRFLASLDLGVSGAFVPSKEVLKITFNSDTSQDKLDLVSQKLSEIYSKYFGWADVKIKIYD